MAIPGRLGMLVLLLTAAVCAADRRASQDQAQGNPAWAERERSLLLGAFNVQIFGARKISKPAVLHSLGQGIISRYDVLLLQEIRDRESMAVDVLVRHLNRISTDRFRYAVSERLGRTSSKEQYAFLFKSSKVIATGIFQYSDPQDEFEREPFAVRFHSNSTDVGTFAVMGIHTSPKAAEKELDALVKAYEVTAQALDVQNVIIAGDFNADCSYVTGREWAGVRLRTDPRFEWLLGDDIDSTVGNSNCAYDRFVVTGDELKAAIVPDSVGVVYFDRAQGLTPAEAKLVSDHYPIELQLRGKVITPTGVDMTRSFSAESLLSIDNVPTLLTTAMSVMRSDATIDVQIVSGTQINNNLGVVVTLRKCAGGFAVALREYRRVYGELLPASLIDSMWKSIWDMVEVSDIMNVQPWMGEQLSRVRSCALHYRMVAPFTCRLTVEQMIV
ncbi:Deoxyribonuclease-1 [Lamellibrachia satsuma]|nr:Deoxyribonuclease-1 [Lamellibrachia satsuma]